MEVAGAAHPRRRRPQRELRADGRPRAAAARAQHLPRADRVPGRRARDAAAQAVAVHVLADGDVPEQVPWRERVRRRAASRRMSVDEIAKKVDGRRARRVRDEALELYRTRRRALLGPPRRRRARAASIPRASSPTSSTATSTTRTSASRAATSARSIGRSDRRGLRARLRRDLPEDRRDDRASAACSCCCRAGTIPTCRSTWYEDLFRAVKERYPDVQAARAVAARSHSPLAAVAAAGARR